MSKELNILFWSSNQSKIHPLKASTRTLDLLFLRPDTWNIVWKKLTNPVMCTLNTTTFSLITSLCNQQQLCSFHLQVAVFNKTTWWIHEITYCLRLLGCIFLALAAGSKLCPWPRQHHIFLITEPERMTNAAQSVSSRAGSSTCTRTRKVLESRVQFAYFACTRTRTRIFYKRTRTCTRTREK